jgi:hydroxypyruvate isomerase
VARSGYDGCIGLEYLPKGATAESLAWLPREDRAWSDS